MRYFVIGDDGQKYGPADVATLNDWIGQQRLLPTQQLEEEASGTRMAASSVPGLNFPLQGASSVGPQPPTGSPYAGGSVYGAQSTQFRNRAFADDGAKDVQTAWIFAVTGLLCCLFLHIGSFSYAQKAAIKGNPGANGPRIFSSIVLGIQVLLSGFQIYYYVTHPGANPFNRHA